MFTANIILFPKKNKEKFASLMLIHLCWGDFVDVLSPDLLVLQSQGRRTYSIMAFLCEREETGGVKHFQAQV